MVFGLASNLLATSDGIFEKVKEEVNLGTINMGLIE